MVTRLYLKREVKGLTFGLGWSFANGLQPFIRMSCVAGWWNDAEMSPPISYTLLRNIKSKI